VRFTRSEQIAQLPQATLKDYSYSLPLGFALAGSYAGALSVRDAGGTVLATSSTSFTVLSSAATGSGLTGHLERHAQTRSLRRSDRPQRGGK